MTKIIHIITGLGDGGAEAVLHRLCTAARPAAIVSLSGAGKYTDLLVKKGIDVIHLDMPSGRVTLHGLKRLWTVLRQYNPDVVQTWMYHGDLIGGVVARLAGCRHVVWNVRHTDLGKNSVSFSTRLVARACALLSAIVPSRIIACAESARDTHIRLGYAAQKFIVVPNGYDVDRFQPDVEAGATLRQELGLPVDLPVIGLVGRWNPQKDHRNLLEAASLLMPSVAFRVVLVGGGCDRDNAELLAIVGQYKLTERALLLGRRNDIPAVMNMIDIHVLSSYSEAFPNVVAEAMACGTPCVVTDVGDAAVIVSDTGWVVPPQNPIVLSEAVAAALDERSDRLAWLSRQSCARARIVEHFSLAQMVVRYRAVWNEAAAGRA